MNNDIVNGTTHQVTEQDAESMFNKLTYTPRATVDGKYRNQRQYDNLMVLWNRVSNNYYQKQVGFIQYCNRLDISPTRSKR